jgi:hypothetical protein
MDESTLHEIERKLHAADNKISTSFIASLGLKLIFEVRRLRHELNDPNYTYGQGRIPRQALVSRDARIDELMEEASIYRKTIAELRAKYEPTEIDSATK